MAPLRPRRTAVSTSLLVMLTPTTRSRSLSIGVNSLIHHPFQSTFSGQNYRRHSLRCLSMTTESSSKRGKDPSSLDLAASRLGLDPRQNRFHAPYVFHEEYSFADWPPNHTFPMDKFERLANALLTTCSKTVSSSNLPRPLVSRANDFFDRLTLNKFLENGSTLWTMTMWIDS